MAKFDGSLLSAALVGYQARLQELDERMAEIRKELGGRTSGVVTGDGAKPKRQLSATALKHISEAMKKRWAAYRAAKKKAAKKAAPAKKAVVKTAAAKRKLSAAQKAALVANLAKARAAKAAKKTEGETVRF